MRVRVPPVLPIGDVMYENPYKFEVGDLVSWARTERTTHHGIITKKRRQSYYVEARPIKCVEEDQYLVVVGDGADSTSDISFAGALADLDEDGDLDLVIGTHDKKDRILYNDGDATFTEPGITAGAFPDNTETDTHAILIGEF